MHQSHKQQRKKVISLQLKKNLELTIEIQL